jgi:ABC-type Zn uptake system ZnuABC Zn-binding protein ZnuA
MSRPGLLLSGLGMLAGALLFVGCSRGPDPWEGETGRRIVVTIPPLYCFVKAVGKDRVSIRSLCTTTGPHHFEADSRDTRLLEGADALFSIGLELDDKFAGALHGLSGRKNLPHVKLGSRLPAGMVLKMRAHTHEAKKPGQGGHAHTHGELDPHVWLGMNEVVAMVEVIRDQLSEIDADHAAEYGKNAKEYIATIRRLHEDGKKLFAAKKVKRIISFHDALEYFARSFGLTIAEVIELAPGDHPTTVHLRKLVKLCSETPVGAITVEPQYPDSISARMVQKELEGEKVAIELVTIDPLETADPAELKQEGAAWYETRMRQNLKALAGVLK